MSFRTKVINILFSKSSHVVSNILIIIIASRILSKLEYGTYRQTFLVFETASPFIALGLFNSIYYFLPRTNNKKKLINQFLLINFISTLVFGSFIIFGGASFISSSFNNDQIQKLVYCLIPFAMANLSIPILNALFVYKEETKTLAIVNTIFTFSLMFLMISVIFIFYNAESAVYTRIIYYIIFSIFLYFQSRRIIINDNEEKQTNTKNTTYKEILFYSIPLGIASMVGILSTQLDKILVSSFSLPSDFAIYINGAIEIPLISLITGSLSTAAISDMSLYCKEGKFDEALLLFKRVSEISGIFLFPLMIFFFC